MVRSFSWRAAWLALGVMVASSACTATSSEPPLTRGTSSSSGFSSTSSGFASSSSGGSSSSSSSSTGGASSGVLGTWSTLEMPGHPNLHAVAFGAAGAFAVGDDGVIMQFANGFWAAQESPTQQPLWGVWADPTSVYAVAVGSGGTVLTYNGATWSSVDTHLSTEIPLNAVWGTSSNQVFVVGGQVGGQGVVYAFNGVTWTSQLPAGSAGALFAVGGDRGGGVWAAGEGSTVWNHISGTWYLATPRGANTLLALASVGDGAMTVGLNGKAMINLGMQVMGPGWTTEEIPTTSSLLGVAGLPDGSAMVSGEHGTLLLRDAHGLWADVGLPTTVTLWGMATQGNTVLVVGDNGTSFIYR